MAALRAATLAAAAAAALAWVLPGTSPTQYLDGAPVDLKVNKLTSPKTHLGFEYYKDMPFCTVRWRTIRVGCAPAGSVVSPRTPHPTPPNRTCSPRRLLRRQRTWGST